MDRGKMQQTRPYHLPSSVCSKLWVSTTAVRANFVPSLFIILYVVEVTSAVTEALSFPWVPSH